MIRAKSDWHRCDAQWAHVPPAPEAVAAALRRWAGSGAVPAPWSPSSVDVPAEGVRHLWWQGPFGTRLIRRCWAPHEVAPRHGHDAPGAEWMRAGQLCVCTWSAEGTMEETVWRTGHLHALPVSCVHAVHNRISSWAESWHLYAPPERLQR